MFSSEYCEIFKNTYFEEHLLTAASLFLKAAIEQWWAAASVLTLNIDNLLINIDNLLFMTILILWTKKGVSGL